MRSVEIEALIRELKGKRSLFVLTGAGISADSGIPTFRGRDGLWRRYRPTDLATPEAFARDPKLVWEWYHYRQSIILKAEPNPGHYALARLEDIFPSFLLLTQNVDGLHQRAGSRKVLEIHGNIFRARCVDCGRVVAHELVPDLPRCRCGGLMRPDVVWFGEPVPEDVLREAFTFISGCDLLLVIGTSGVVQPAASIPIFGKNRNKTVAIINPEPTPLSVWADYEITGRAADVLPQIVKEVE